MIFFHFRPKFKYSEEVAQTIPKENEWHDGGRGGQARWRWNNLLIFRSRILARNHATSMISCFIHLLLCKFYRWAYSVRGMMQSVGRWAAVASFYQEKDTLLLFRPRVQAGFEKKDVE